MGFLSRQQEERERTPEERAYARAVREARRKGEPEPEPPPGPHEPVEDEPVSDGVHGIDDPPAVEPEPEPEREPPEVEPTAARIPHEEPVAAPLRWDVTEEWDVAGETQGDPVEPSPPPAPEPVEEPPDPADESPEPHGDPLAADEPDPAAALPPRTSNGGSDRRGVLARLGAGRGDDRPPRALGRELPPLPAPAAARQPPEPPRRPRGGAPPPPPGRPAPRHRRRWRVRALAFTALVLVGAAVTLAIALFEPFKGEGSGTVRVTVPNGATARDIGELLEQRGVVTNGRLFALRATLSGKRGDFKSGGFVLKRDMTYSDAMAVLTTNPGAAPTVRVTIPEGRARREAAPLLRQAGISGDYLDATSGRPPRDLSAPRRVRSLEGFLFPATFELPKRRATADAVVAEQLKAFRANIPKVDLRRARRANLTRYDVLIIASMVEREAQIPRERRLIAAVIYNRLKDGIPLGIDATIRYAVHNWSTPLKVSELNVDSPYNLRKHTGLPPTPIGSPGLASIQAAANPAHVSYLYYVVKPGGKGAHAFSSTDAQFQRDVRRYNQARERNGGRSPAG